MTAQQQFMARALQLAERGLYTTHPNPRVGCVLVKNDVILAEGWHQQAGQGHAEVNALNALGRESAQGADCYVTLEPCSHTGRTPPCVERLIEAGIRRVIVAMEDPNPLVAGQGITRLRQAGIDVAVGMMADKAEALNKGFCQRMRLGRPYVRSKVAMSLDGRTAMASGESQWITGPDARHDVQRLRAQSSAVMSGIGTVLGDDPQLTVRIAQALYPENHAIRQPLIVIVDSQLRLLPSARVFKTEAKKLLATIVQPREVYDAEVVTLPANNGRVDLNALMSSLAQYEINDVLVESGPILNGALLELGLIDEIIIYMAPKLMGDAAKGLFHLPAMKTMSQNIDLDIVDIRAVGKDWRITAKPHYQF